MVSLSLVHVLASLFSLNKYSPAHFFFHSAETLFFHSGCERAEKESCRQRTELFVKIKFLVFCCSLTNFCFLLKCWPYKLVLAYFDDRKGGKPTHREEMEL